MFIERVTNADIHNYFKDRGYKSLDIKCTPDCITVLLSYGDVVYNYRLYDFKLNDGKEDSSSWIKFLATKFGDEYLKEYHRYLKENAELQFIRIADELNEKVDCNNSLKLEDYTGRQERIFQNKVNHRFNTKNVYQEARYILEETAELMRAIEKHDMENLKEELADIVIFAYGCAAVAGVGDLDAEIFKKMKINENREYKQTPEGDFVKKN